jgi:hypothetical protein
MGKEWYDILDLVETLHARAKEEASTLWFRGQRCAHWSLQSSLHRRIDEQFKVIGDPSNLPDKQRQLREEYRSAFYLFKADAFSMIQPHERNNWGILFAMQHQRIPTRLLDWTESFTCALFFAQFERNEGDNAAVFALNADKLNQISTGHSGLISIVEDATANTNVPIAEWLPTCLLRDDHPPLKTVAIVPQRTNQRMMAQRATFTICGDSFSPLEREYCSCITKIDLPASLYDDAESFLEVMGVGATSYFPDLEGLAMCSREKHRFELRYAKRAIGNDSSGSTGGSG